MIAGLRFPVSISAQAGPMPSRRILAIASLGNPK